jgi:hypothetical protein
MRPSRQPTRRRSGQPAPRQPTRTLVAALMLTAGSILCVPSAQAQTPQSQTPQGQSPQTQSPRPSPQQGQTPQGQQQAPDQPQQQTNIPDQKLDAAAAAIKQVATIKQDYQRKLDSAAPSDQDKIATEANDALQKAVTDQGLSVDEYSSILEVAQNDPGVRQKIIQRLNQANRQ